MWCICHKGNQVTILSAFYKHKGGGYNKRLYKVYLALAKRGHIVHYIAVESFPIEHPNIRKHLLWAPFTKEENIFFWAYFIVIAPLYCLWIAWRHNVTHIIVFSSSYAFFCALVKLFLEIKMITFLRADVLKEALIAKKSRFKIRLLLLFERVGIKLSDIVVPNSKSLADVITKRHDVRSLDILPNNIEEEMFVNGHEKKMIRNKYGLNEDHFIIATASPFNRVKNVEFLIKAFSKVGLENARLIIIGEDLGKTGERKRLERLSFELGIQDKVTFTGWLDNPSRTIASADIFAFPSLQEGSPNALLEALSCKIPCLGSRIPEIAEILQYEELLFSLSDPSELADKLHRSMTDLRYFRIIKRLSNERKQAYLFEWDSQAISIIMAT